MSAVPLTPEYLFEALQAASSQSQELVQNASARLKSWETVSGYWSMLQVCDSESYSERGFPWIDFVLRTCSSTARSQ